MRRHYRLTGHGAVVADKVTLTFAQLYQQNQPRFKGRHDALFFLKIKTLRHTIAGAIAECFSPQ